MTPGNDLIEPQQWYRWHDRGAPAAEFAARSRRGRFHFGDIVVRDLVDDVVSGDGADVKGVGEAFRRRGFGDVSVTFRCHGIVRIEGEQLTMAQLAEDESSLTVTVRVTAPKPGQVARMEQPSAQIIGQFMTGDFVGLDTTDPSAALMDFELRARAEALAFLQRDDQTVDGSRLARQLGVSQRRLHGAFRNTGNSVRATLRCG